MEFPILGRRFTISQVVVEKISFTTRVESAKICSSKQSKPRKERKKINPCKLKENAVNCSTYTTIHKNVRN